MFRFVLQPPATPTTSANTPTVTGYTPVLTQAESSQTPIRTDNILPQTPSLNYSADDMPLPNYSDRIKGILVKEKIVEDIDKFIEETAYHIILHGDFKDTGSYAEYGRRLCHIYPCLAFSGENPWV